MALVKLEVPCVIKNKIGNNLYAEPIFGVARNSLCAVLKLDILRKPTTVRTDSSATRGHADEEEAVSKFLLMADEVISLDDYLFVNGVPLRISSIRYRYNIHKKIDHLEVEASFE
jgi:hypothetical protein